MGCLFMTQKTFKYCSVRYAPGEPNEVATPSKERTPSAIYINFPETRTREEYEESFQAKRMRRICSRLKDIPGVTEITWDTDFISIGLHDKAQPHDLLPKIGAILHDEEREFDRAEREQTKAEIEKLIASVTKENYEDILAKGHAALDQQTEKENARARNQPGIQADYRVGRCIEIRYAPKVVEAAVAEMEKRLDRLITDGGLSLRDVKSVTPDGRLKSVREVTYRFPYAEFLVVISILWEPSNEPLWHPLPTIFAEVLLGEIPDEPSDEFTTLVLRMNKRLSIPAKIGWIYDRCFGLVARWALASLDPAYQDAILRQMLPIASAVYSEVNEQVRIPTWKQVCDAKERKPC